MKLVDQMSEIQKTSVLSAPLVLHFVDFFSASRFRFFVVDFKFESYFPIVFQAKYLIFCSPGAYRSDFYASIRLLHLLGLLCWFQFYLGYLQLIHHKLDSQLFFFLYAKQATATTTPILHTNIRWGYVCSTRSTDVILGHPPSIACINNVATVWIVGRNVPSCWCIAMYSTRIPQEKDFCVCCEVGA